MPLVSMFRRKTDLARVKIVCEIDKLDAEQCFYKYKYKYKYIWPSENRVWDWQIRCRAVLPRVALWKLPPFQTWKFNLFLGKGNCGECAKKCVNALPHISTTTTHGTSNNPLSILELNNNNNNNDNNSNRLYPKKDIIHERIDHCQ